MCTRVQAADVYSLVIFFFLNDTAPTEIYTLSLHDALPIFGRGGRARGRRPRALPGGPPLADHDRPRGDVAEALVLDRKSTRLNSSHANISYAVFCLKKKKLKKKRPVGSRFARHVNSTCQPY